MTGNINSKLSINRDLSLLHPTFREAIVGVLSDLHEEGIQFAMFEGYRYPERQQQLYKQGRTIPGARVTNAQEWQSYHQYGLAADLVLYINNSWSWDTSSKDKLKMWNRMNEVGELYGLEALSFELPHLQLANIELDSLINGIYPTGGDSKWITNLLAAKKEFNPNAQ